VNRRYNYAREKLFSAIETLATLSGDVRSRLFAAYSAFHPLREDDFPDELKEDWRWIERSLTKFGPIYNYKGEVVVGSVEKTLKRIRNRTGEKIARRLFHLFYELHFNKKYFNNL